MDHPFADGEPVYDVTFENVQAGLRTDYLFRLANHRGGIVLGTGDLSELALGWCTYGVGDQMSHYAVNTGVPKTLIQSRKAGRPGCRLRDAALLPLPGARLRLGVSDDGAVPPARWSGVLRRLQVHRLPVLHARVSVGRADRGMGQTRAEDRKVHALRRSDQPARAHRVQRAAGASPTRPNGSSRRSRPRPASRRAPRTPCATEPATRCSRSPTSASRTARTSTSTTSTARRKRAARRCCTSRRCRSRNSDSRRYGEKPYPKFTAAALGAVPPAVMAIGAALGAVYAFFKKRAHAVAGADGHGHHVGVRAPPAEATDAVQLAPPGARWPSAACRSWRGSPSVSAAARTSPTPIPGGCGSPSTSSGSPWRRARSRWRASSTSSSEKTSTGLGRTAVLMGLLSYSFVTVTLVADLGLPWHSYQLALQCAGPLGDVRGLVVRRPLRHDPAARVPAGRPRALGIPKALAALAAVARRLRRRSP